MSDKVSVIVPSYNHARFLKPCLLSALSQTHQNLEVLVFDDRSMDDSVAIASGIKDERLSVHQNESNLGTYGTQAAALAAATGDWVAILNSDDVWLPDKLEKQIAALRANDGLWCYTLGGLISEDGKRLHGEAHGDWSIDAVQDILPRLLDVNRILASSVVFKRGAVHFRRELRYCGDWVAWLALAEKAPAVCVPEKLTLWRQHETNSYRRSNALTLEEILVRRAILDRKDEWFARSKDEAAVATGLSSCAMALSALYVLVGQMRLARASAKMALNLKPKSGAAKRRRLVTALPKKIALRRLWPDQDLVDVDLAEIGHKVELLGQ